MLQRLSFGVALLATITLACSDDETSRIMAQGPKTASAEESRSAHPSHDMGRDNQIQWGPAPPIFPAGAAIRCCAG